MEMHASHTVIVLMMAKKYNDESIMHKYSADVLP